MSSVIVDQELENAKRILREQGSDALTQYFLSLDPQLTLAIHGRLIETNHNLKVELQTALDDHGILNDPESSRYAKWRAARRTEKRRRKRDR